MSGTGWFGLDPPAVVAATLLVAAFAVISCVMSAPDVFFSTDGGSKYIMTRAFLERDPSFPALPYPGRAIDPAGDFFPIREAFSVRSGQYYLSAFPIYFPIVSSVGLRLFAFRGLNLLPLLSAAVALLCFARLGRGQGWTSRRTVTGMVLLAIATPFGFYASTFWEHVPALALVMLALALLPRTLDRPPRTRIFLSGLLMGSSVALRFECLWLVPALLLAIMSVVPIRETPFRAVATWVAGVAVALGLLALANITIYGLLVGPQVFANFAYPRLSHIAVASRMLVGSGTGPLLLTAAVSTLALGFARGRVARWACVIGAGAVALRMIAVFIVEVGRGVAYRPYVGLLETSLFFLLVPLCKGRREGTVGLASLVLGRAAVFSAVAIALTSPVDGGLQGGSRLMLPSTVLALVALLDRVPSARWHRMAVITSLVVSIPLSLRAMPYLLDRLNHVDHPALVQIRAMPADAIVYANSHYPQGLAVSYWDRPSFMAELPRERERLFHLLALEGARSALLISKRSSTDVPRFPADEAAPLEWVRTRREQVAVYQCDTYSRAPMEGK